MSNKKIKHRNDKKVNLSSVVYAKLKKQIIGLHYRFGQKLNDGELASQFHVSRTPVREALSKLEQEGFVSKAPNVGYFLKQFSLKDIRELYFTRRLLEMAAAKITVKVLDSEKIHTLHQAVISARELLDTENLDAYTQASWEMHRRLVFYSNNQLLYQLITNLGDKMRMASRIGFRSSARLLKSQEEHEAIIHLLKEREFRAFLQTLNKHIKSAEKNTLKSIVENVDKVYL